MSKKISPIIKIQKQWKKLYNREWAVCIKKLILVFLYLCHCFIADTRTILLYMDQWVVSFLSLILKRRLY